MTTRRKPSSRESKRIHSRSGVGGSDRIHYGDVSDALTEVLREETRLPRPAASVLHRMVLAGGSLSVMELDLIGSDCDGWTFFHGDREVRLLRIWEARNIKLGGDLMGVDKLLLDSKVVPFFNEGEKAVCLMAVTQFHLLVNISLTVSPPDGCLSFSSIP
ncbi:hypothetical protein Bca101_071472 [Brassica carinata]